MTNRTAIVNRALAAVLKGAYTTEDLTLPEVAKRTGIPGRTVQRIMSGEAPITMGQLENIAQALGRDPQELFEDALKKADRDERSGADGTTASLDEKRNQREAAKKADGALEGQKRVAKKKNAELGGDEPSPA